MKRVLVTNDDGIGVRGLVALVEALGKTCEVYAVAPKEQQSARGMAITFRREVEVEKTEVSGAAEAYVVDGTPVDCVKWALKYFRGRDMEFDYVFSGINLGANVGIAAYYSGTIAAAREGALNGVRSIALSVGTHDSTHFEYICSLLPKMMDVADTLNPSTFLSVNAPDLPPWKVRGLRFAEVAPFGYAEEYAFSPAGENTGKTAGELVWDRPLSFQMSQKSLDGKPSAGKSSEIGPGMLSRTGEPVTEADLRYDLDCMRYGFAAITPLSTGNSDDVALRKIQGRFSSDNALAVFIDLHENTSSGLEMRNRFEGSMGRFSACIRRLGMPVFITELAGGGRLINDAEELIRAGRCERAVRRELSAWGCGDFVRMMAATSARKVLIAGLETHAAVLQTALDFVSKGYEVTVIEDCCASRNGHDHKVAIERMRDAGCTITTSRAAVMELVSTVSHPAAEAIRKILD